MPRIESDFSVKCKCGWLQSTSEIKPHHDGAQVKCGDCGATYRVVVQWMVHIQDEATGKTLKYVK